MKVLSALKYKFEFRLGYGNSSFWFSNWSGIGKLEKQILYMDIHDIEIRVNDITQVGIWTSIHYILILLRLFVTAWKCFPFFLNSLVPDLLSWKGILECIYTARDDYNRLNRLEFVQNTIENGSWKSVSILLPLRRWNSSFGKIYIRSFLRDQCCVIMILKKWIFVQDAIRTPRRLYTTW